MTISRQDASLDLGKNPVWQVAFLKQLIQPLLKSVVDTEFEVKAACYRMYKG